MVTMRSVDHDDVYPRLTQRTDSIQRIRPRAHRCADAQAPDAVLAGIGEFRGLLKVLDGNHSLQFMIPADHQDLFDAVLVQQRQHLVFGSIFAHRDQAVLRRHHRGDRCIQLGLETQIAMRDDPDHLGAEYHGYARDVFRAREFQNLPNRHIRVHGNGIADHAAFELLHPIDLPRLLVDRHVLVNDADAAFLGNRDGKACLGNRVHCGRDHR